eukprot:scaffold176462_cov15-Tisochrysis_lutea.AAC.1
MGKWWKQLLNAYANFWKKTYESWRKKGHKEKKTSKLRSVANTPYINNGTGDTLAQGVSPE